jgi:hypothetical protein
MRYVHIPIGYDSIPAEKQLLLSQTIAQMPKPIFVHCHHGKHRGPATAAIMARFGLGTSAADATLFMQQAGTSPDYSGLYESVSRFAAPDPKTVAELKSPLPETVDVSTMVDLMVEIDTRMDNLKAWSSIALEPKQGLAGTRSGIDPIQEAIQLRELVRDSARLPECRDRPAAFTGHFSQLETDLTRWVDSLKAQKDLNQLPPAAQKNLAIILKSAAGQCTGCHRSYRDRKGPAESKNP